MRTIGQMRRTPQRQMPMCVIENADPAAFGGDIDTVSARVVGQHVGRFADSVVIDHVSVGQINCDHGGVGFTADEHHVVGDVESLTVRVVAAGCGNPFFHSETDRVYDGQVVAALHRDHHLVEERVVHNVSHLTTQWDSRADCAGVASITVSVPAASLVVHTVRRMGS